MSMSASLESMSCTAIVLDAMRLPKGGYAVKLEYIDAKMTEYVNA